MLDLIFITEIRVLPLLQEDEDVFVPDPALDTVGVPAATLSKLTELLVLLPDVPQKVLGIAQLIEVNGWESRDGGWDGGWD